jgi:hypothetical protein
MPFVLMAIGGLIGGFALYRFMLTATPKQVGALVLSIGMVFLSSALFFLAVTGRFPAALGIIAAMAPLALSWWQARRKTFVPKGQMSDYDALEILGLKEGASAEDVIDAHKRLMKKVHPDSEGSEGLAKNLNAARDQLLKK